jgi:hypothetical protein
MNTEIMSRHGIKKESLHKWLLISFDFIYYLTNFDSRIEQLTALFYFRAYCL